MSNAVIIVAGGSGTRYGSDIPKQFLNLNGRPVLMWTIQNFHDFDPALEIVVVLPESQFEFWKDLRNRHQFKINHTIVAGGSERFYSVKNGLLAVSNSGIIAIHDAVRPLVSTETLKRCFDEAETSGAVIPVLTPVESLREVNGPMSKHVNRDHYRIVQTPQCFKKRLILNAFTQDFNPTFTDDASVAEAAGNRIAMVEGNRENLKITTPVDLKLAEFLLSNR